MLTLQHRIKLVELFLHYRTLVKTQREFCKLFPKRKAPQGRTITKLVKKFQSTGSVVDRARTGRPKAARSAANIELVRRAVLQSPETSTRRRNLQLGLSRTTLRRVLNDDLNLFPYKIQIKQQLNDGDKQSRLVMCRWFNGMLEADDGWINDVWFTDEAHFYLNGLVNKQNYRFWGSEKPGYIAERPLHSPKCTAWCAISAQGILGPFWVEDEDGETVTVTAERYRNILLQFWIALGRKKNVKRDKSWFQQDGATAHTANQTLDWLHQKFGDRLISRRTNNVWASHSPDLNPPDFFLWGYIKDRVYLNKPRNIPELKAEVCRIIKSIHVDMCSSVINNFAVRVRECLVRGGTHIEHVL